MWRSCLIQKIRFVNLFYLRPASNSSNVTIQHESERLKMVVDPMKKKTLTEDPLKPLLLKLIEDHERREMKRYSNVPMFHRRVTEMLKYNLLHPRGYLPISVREAYELIEDPSRVTPEKLHLADIMDCCLRIMLTMMVIGDDILDGHETRFGKPSWCTVIAPSPQIAINDLWIGNIIYSRIASAHLTGTSVYPRAVEIINECSLETLIGQYHDLTASATIDLNNFTIEYVRLLGEYKTAPGLIVKSLALALLLTGIEPTDEAVARNVGAQIGFLYEVQNDFLDCYKTDDYRNINTDIEDGKPTWLIAKALELADEQQREVLKQNYGKKDPAAAQNVKQVYDQLNLRGVYIEFTEQFYCDMDKTLSHLPKIGKVYKHVLDKIIDTSYHP